MKVVSYKKCGKNSYEVFLDNGCKYKLYEDIIIEYELLIDKNVNEVKLNKMLSDNELLDAYYKALKYITIKMRTKKEIEVLLKKYFGNDAINYVLDKLEKDGYLDEEKYVQAFINDSINLSNNGPKKIVNNLLNLGIHSDIIMKYLNYDKEFWQDRIKNITTKSAKKNKSSAPVFKNKMYKQLLLLGYDSDDIKGVIDDFKIDVSDAFYKDAKKIWKRLEKEDNADKKIWMFRNKMILKGYNQDDINEFIKKETI